MDDPNLRMLSREEREWWLNTDGFQDAKRLLKPKSMPAKQRKVDRKMQSLRHLQSQIQGV